MRVRTDNGEKNTVIFFQDTKRKEETRHQKPLEMYGPMFTCVSCHCHHFLTTVVELPNVEALRSEEARNRFLDVPYIASNPSLFVQLDQHWVCRRCREVLSSGNMPPLAAKNKLAATWAALPKYLRSLSPTEADMAGLTRVSRYWAIGHFLISSDI